MATLTEAKYQLLAKFPTEHQAYIAHSDLASQGIDSVIEGANANAMLSYVGPALGGVRLLVRAEDYSQAQNLIQQKSVQPTEHWYCGKCHEVLEGSFATCWSCGQDREIVEASMPASALMEFTAESESTQSHQSLAEADELVRRAWQAALISTFILPIILNLYSIFLWFKAIPHLGRMNHTGYLYFIGTAAINLLLVFAYVVIWRAFQ